MIISEADKARQKDLEQHYCYKIDHTIKCLITECQRKTYFSIIRGITPINEPDYFVSGRAWDAGLGAWHEEGTPADRLVNAHKAIDAVYRTANCSFFNPLRDQDNLLKLLDKYIARGPEPFDIIGSNLGFALPYEDFFIAGELDSYINYKSLGILVGENKTTIMVIGNKSGWDRYIGGYTTGQYANQCSTYHWAVKQIAEDCWGIRAMIASLDIPKRETTERQLFQPLMLQRNECQTDDVIESYSFAMNLLRSCWTNWQWPRTGNHCTGSWGFSRCEYLPLCQLNMPLSTYEGVYIPSNLYLTDQPWLPWDGIKRKQEKSIVERRDEQVGGVTQFKQHYLV